MLARLRIAVVVRCFAEWGGLEQYTARVVEGLLDRGLKITVVCQTRELDLSHPNLRFLLMDPPGRGLSKSDRLRHDYEAAQRLFLRQERFDILHSQHYPVHPADVVTFHNHTVRDYSRSGRFWENVLDTVKSRVMPAYRLRDSFDDMLAGSARCLVFSSQLLRDDYYSRFPALPARQAPWVVAYPGSELPAAVSSGVPPAIASLSGDPAFNFLFVGKGYRKKGLDVILDACSILRSRVGPGRFKLVVAGLTKKPMDDLRLRLLGLDDTVIYIGFQQNMHQVYPACQSIVNASRLESFGMAVFQGMRYGLVPIVGRRSGASELVTHDRDGLILENHLDASDLAQLMERLLTDESLRIRLGHAAREAAERRSWQDTVDATIQAYLLAWQSKNFTAPSGEQQSCAAAST